MLELLEEEIIIDMALMGVTRIDQITSKYVCKAAPKRFAHEMSAFRYISGRRSCADAEQKLATAEL